LLYIVNEVEKTNPLVVYMDNYEYLTLLTFQMEIYMTQS